MINLINDLFKGFASFCKNNYFCLNTRIDSVDFDKDNQTPILYIVIDNKLNHDIAITKILINKKGSFDYADGIKSVNSIIPAHLSCRFRLLCPFLKPDEAINIEVFTSIRRKSYKCRNNISILERSKRLHKEK